VVIEKDSLSTEGIDVEDAGTKETFNMYIPNVFSPGIGPQNGHFEIYSNVELSIKEMVIFDRWGSVVFRKSNVTISQYERIVWDGLLHGDQLDKGYYTYQLIYAQANNKVQSIEGQILLL